MEKIIKTIKRWWKQLLCRHTDTGIHSHPFSYRHGNGIRYGVWQRKVCLQCGKVIERGHAYQEGISKARMNAVMRSLRAEGQAFAIKRKMQI